MQVDLRRALLLGVLILSSILAADGIVLGEEEEQLLLKLLEEFSANPTHSRYDFSVQPGLTDAKLLPKVFIWCPMQHFGITVYCPDHKCPMTLHSWTSGLRIRGLRLVYDLHGDIVLVQSTYTCKHNLPDRTSHGHEYASASPQILESLPRALEMKFPFKLYYRSACSQTLLDYLIVHIGRGHSFLELAEDIAAMNFGKFLQLHKNIADEDVFYNSIVYSSPGNDQLMHMFLAHFNSVEYLFQNEMGSVPCSILHFDHSFKVNKHIGINENSTNTFTNQFKNLFIGINENGQVVTWRLTKSTDFDQVEDLLADLKNQLDARGQSLSMIIVDDCCSVRALYNGIFPGVPVLEDLEHVCHCFVNTLPKGCTKSQQLSKEFGLIFRMDGDTSHERKLPTASAEVVDANLQMFLIKWEPSLSNSTMDAVRIIRKHILNGCCTGIPAGDTQRNENLHKYLKRSLLGGASVISPELAVALFSVVLYIWNRKKDPDAKRHVSNARVIPVAPTALRHFSFKTGNVPTEVPAAMSDESCNDGTSRINVHLQLPQLNICTVEVADIKNDEVLKYVLDRALHLLEVLSSVEKQCITRAFDIFNFPFSDVKRLVSFIHPNSDDIDNVLLETEMNTTCLERHLSSFGLQLDSVPGDGNCCFTSIVKEVHKVIVDRCDDTSQYIEFLKSIGLGKTIEIDTDHLRHLFCKEIETNTGRYEAWVDFDVKSELEKFSKSGWFNCSLGDLCVIACSNVLKTPIVVITALPASPFIPFIPAAILDTGALYIAFNHSLPGHYDATKVVYKGAAISEQAKKGCNCGVMSKQKGVKNISSCDTNSSKCSCLKKGESCARQCRCVNCKNSPKEETTPVTGTGTNKGCTCGIMKRADATYVSCKDGTRRKSKCPCLRKNTYCSISCKCYNCGNALGGSPTTSTNALGGSPTTSTNALGGSPTTSPAPPSSAKKRKRSHPEPYKRTRSIDYLAGRSFGITSGPWTELESTILYVVIEVIMSTSVTLTSHSIYELYNFVASSKAINEMALPVAYKSFAKIVEKLSFANLKHSVFESLVVSIVEEHKLNAEEYACADISFIGINFIESLEEENTITQ